MRIRDGIFAGLLVTASSHVSIAQPAQPVIPSVSNTAPLPGLAVPTEIEDLPVMARPRPEFDALGIHVGGFLLFPQIKVDATHDSNVFRTSDNELDDFFFTLSPSLRLRSDWGRNALEFYGGLNDYRYLKFTQENLTDWNAGADGRYDIAEGASLFANGSAAEEHESLASPNVVGNQQSPTRYYDKHAELSPSIQFNRLGFTAGGIFDRYDYTDTPLVGGGLEDNADRNFDDYQAYLKSSYDFSPGYSVFVKASYDSRQYDQYLDRNGLHRSSIGYRTDGGVDLQLTHLISGQVYLGYLKYSFATPLPDVSGVDYGVKLDWLATPLITVHLEGSRTLNPITLVNASIQDTRSVALSLDYELKRNVIIQARADYLDSSYPGIIRHDKEPDFAIGVKYLLNHLISLDANYTYAKRSTDAPGGTFQNNSFTVGVTLHE